MWSNISMVNLYMFILFVWMELQLKVINLPCFCLQKRDSPMEWTESHDVALCKEVLVQNPFLARKKTVQRAAIWQKIADELVSLSRPKFKVTLTKRSVQDRLLLIITKHKRRMATERRESGTSPEISELVKLLEDVVEKEKCYEQRRESEGKITWNQGGLLWKIYILP